MTFTIKYGQASSSIMFLTGTIRMVHKIKIGNVLRITLVINSFMGKCNIFASKISLTNRHMIAIKIVLATVETGLNPNFSKT